MSIPLVFAKNTDGRRALGAGVVSHIKNGAYL
jgi:hypothetical protein